MIQSSTGPTTTRILVTGAVTLSGEGWELASERRADRDATTLSARHPCHPGVEIVIAGGAR